MRLQPATSLQCQARGTFLPSWVEQRRQTPVGSLNIGIRLARETHQPGGRPGLSLLRSIRARRHALSNVGQAAQGLIVRMARTEKATQIRCIQQQRGRGLQGQHGWRMGERSRRRRLQEQRPARDRRTAQQAQMQPRRPGQRTGRAGQKMRQIH